MHFSKFVLVLSAVTAASAMATGFAVRDVHHRHAAVAREHIVAREPEPVAAPVQVLPRKRSNDKRCKAASSSALPSATSAVANAGGAPPTFSSSVNATSTEAATQPTTIVQPTTTKAAAPQTTSTTPAPPPPPTTSKSTVAAPTTTATSSGDPFSGDGTFYSTGLGACGITNVDTDFIAAASFLLFDGFNGYTGANPNNNPICGKKVLAHYQGKQVTVTITDRCAGCFGKYNLDFSPSAFSQLADQTVGRIFGMTWNFI